MVKFGEHVGNLSCRPGVTRIDDILELSTDIYHMKSRTSGNVIESSNLLSRWIRSEHGDALLSSSSDCVLPHMERLYSL